MFEKSGQSVSEFCRTNDLPPATLSLWRNQQKGDTGTDDEGGLVEIPAAALMGTQNTTAVRMQLLNGVRLEVATGTDPAWLGALLKTLMSVDP